MSADMAYTPITQTDADLPANQVSVTSLTSATTPSPTIPELPFQPFDLSFHHESNAGPGGEMSPQVAPENSKVTKLLSSLKGSQNSYDLVEEDDYEETQAVQTATGPMVVATDQVPKTGVEDVPVRTASISRQLPLHNPRPDLQSLQGAYVKNVERLEESAERLSMTSSLEDELQRMKQAARRVERNLSQSSRGSRGSRVQQISANPLSNSIIDVNAVARLGGYSPAAYITSPVGSIQSTKGNPTVNPLRKPFEPSPGAHHIPKASWEGIPFTVNFDNDPMPLQPPMILEPTNPDTRSASNASPDRPDSAGSGDTYQQATTLFNDFDGVHYSATGPGRRISLTRPPLARDSKAFREPQPGEEMIYYPAPVPVMLNLPVRLSRMNWSDREKKRLQALSDMPEDMRQSAPWLNNEEVSTTPARQSKLPPQLRASAFFDQRGTEQNVQLKDGSAVATLESILDAAAHAPVSAFTDHPIAGHLGKEVYGPSTSPLKNMQKAKKKKRKSSATLLQARASSANLSTAASSAGLRDEVDAKSTSDGDVKATQPAAATSEKSHENEEGESEDESESGSGSESEEETQYPGFSKAPTTLLAELQMRKAQQKQRNRTAADAFPNGMHSTLLELDTVTQLQQKARKQKHITLAWEDREEADKENFDDEDVPLGVLYPEKERKDHVSVNRPLGLMEKRELEENEPLSFRRARLRGETLAPPSAPRSATASHAGENVPRLEEPALDEEPEETLAQRLKRIREQKENGSSGAFAKEVSSELGLSVAEPPASKTPDPEETLAQRRRRLREEALKSGGSGDYGTRPMLQPSRSMADLLQRNPTGYNHPNESKTAASAMQTYQQTLSKNPAWLAQQQAALMQHGQSSPQAMQFGHTGYPYNQLQHSVSYQGPGMHNQMYGQGVQMPMAMNMSMNNLTYPYNMQGYGHDAAANGMGPPLDAKQRATIDRWRQGIA